MRLCRCGMRIDDAYTTCYKFYTNLDYDGLEDFVSLQETITKILADCID